jgi:restriction system protein
VWRRTIYNNDLKVSRVIRGDSQQEVDYKALLQINAWNERWEKIQQSLAKRQQVQKAALRLSQKKELALQRTHEAQQKLTALGSILREGIEIDHIVNWESLKDRTSFSVQYPKAVAPDILPEKPLATNPIFQPTLTLLDKLIPARRRRKAAAATEQFRIEESRWIAARTQVEESNKRKLETHEKQIRTWQEQNTRFLDKQIEQHAVVDAYHVAYEAKDIRGLTEHWDHVLSRSEYPEEFPKSFDFDYLPESKLLVLGYYLPDLTALPTLKELKYVATRDEFQEIRVSDVWLNRVYDDVLYQITLRTLYELFQADTVNALNGVVFNGWVNSVDKSNGQDVNACILSVEVTKSDFLQINLANVDPKICFKKLKGVSASKLTSLSPIKPILDLDKKDKRFVASYEVADELDDAFNIGAMDWRDFENLIREIFEKEFSQNGGEVQITQASRDGGVDAIAFDPDPIRGGKIVIQAKRYTNTVGVSAVRDLFGTVHNEGATKGILVTTSDYGPDAYEFANGKPLTLLNGSELLYLLEKHGHKAKIDLREAKRLLAEQEQVTRRPVP